MTREDAILCLKGIKNYGRDTFTAQKNSDWQNSLDMAIKALEQADVLDKIRAKIEKLQKMCDTNDLNLLSQHSAFGMTLDIIDKYKAESEE